jgi:hypothetical protein
MLIPMNEVTLVHLMSDETPPDLSDLLTKTHPANCIEIQVDLDPARTCQAIAKATTTKNLVVIATGGACNQLPGIALAQRATGRVIVGYHLLQPVLPPFTESWPQAPITAHFPAGSTIPREVGLRGITIKEFTGLPEFAQFIENYFL